VHKLLASGAMADVGASDRRVGEQASSLHLTPDEREWLLVAVENELAMRGKLLASEPAFNAVVIGHLRSVYERLRGADRA